MGFAIERHSDGVLMRRCTALHQCWFTRDGWGVGRGYGFAGVLDAPVADLLQRTFTFFFVFRLCAERCTLIVRFDSLFSLY